MPKSIRAPTVILPKYLQGTDPESRLFAEAYFLKQLEMWANEYQEKLVKRRAAYLKKHTDATDPVA